MICHCCQKAITAPNYSEPIYADTNKITGHRSFCSWNCYIQVRPKEPPKPPVKLGDLKLDEWYFNGA